ncbi:MAG: ExbD/TolR family protein [Planctomycetota bacterium JB042]
MRIPDTDDVAEDLSANITPLIDVVFLLLIFFMVATSFLDSEKELNLELPPALSGDATDQAPDELIINVLEDGKLVLAGSEVDTDGLRSALERAARRDPETPVTIRGDGRVKHETIVSVMDACGIAGLRNLAVGTLDAAGG